MDAETLKRLRPDGPHIEPVPQCIPIVNKRDFDEDRSTPGVSYYLAKRKLFDVMPPYLVLDLGATRWPELYTYNEVIDFYAPTGINWQKATSILILRVNHA